MTLHLIVPHDATLHFVLTLHSTSLHFIEAHCTVLHHMKQAHDVAVHVQTVIAHHIPLQYIA